MNVSDDDDSNAWKLPSDDDYHMYMSSSPDSRDYLSAVAFTLVWVDGHRNRERHLTTLRELLDKR